MGLSVGGRLYLSGHTASEFDKIEKRILVRGDMVMQARTAYKKIGAILEAAGGSFSDVVRIVEYLKPDGIERYGEAVAVRKEVFGSHQPTVNTVPVKSLLRADAFIEIEITAVTPSHQKTIERSAAESDKSSGLIFLPTIMPLDRDGNLVGANDIVAQTEVIFSTAERMLRNLGLSLDQVVKTVEYISPAGLADYRRTGDVRRSFLGPVYPAAAGIVMPRLIHPEALIQYDFIASRDTPIAINPGWSRYDKLTYNPGVRAGDILFLAGQGSVNPETGEVEYLGNIGNQAEYIYDNIFKVIQATGGTTRNLIKTIEYVVPGALSNYRDVGAVRSQALSEPFPVSTGLVCDALLRQDMLLEVDPLAVIG